LIAGNQGSVASSLALPRVAQAFFEQTTAQLGINQTALYFLHGVEQHGVCQFSLVHPSIEESGGENSIGIIMPLSGAF
jgi:hypothetical protein